MWNYDEDDGYDKVVDDNDAHGDDDADDDHFAGDQM